MPTGYGARRLPHSTSHSNPSREQNRQQGILPQIGRLIDQGDFRELILDTGNAVTTIHVYPQSAKNEAQDPMVEDEDSARQWISH